MIPSRVLNYRFGMEARYAPAHTPFSNGPGMRTAWVTIKDFKSSRQHNKRWMSGVLFEKPTDHITVQNGYLDGRRQTEAEHFTMYSMLKTMKQLLTPKESLYEGFHSDMNPILSQIDKYLQSESYLMSTSLVFGMQLLVESFKSRW